MSEIHNFENEKWDIDHPVTFNFEPQDSISNFDLFIKLRNTERYDYNNLFLVSQIKFPKGKTVTDTLEYQMTDPEGNYLGSGSRDVFENKLWLKEGVRFRESGTYQLILKHAMRKNGQVNGIKELAGILDIGYSIEKKNVTDGKSKN